MSQRRTVMPPRTLGQPLDFMRRLWALEHELQAGSKRMEATLGITGPQRLAVRIIVKHPGLSAKHLAETLRLHPSTVTGVIRRLVERGLIVRRVDAEDARGVRLYATPAGRRLTRSASGTVEAAVTRTLRTIEPADLRSAYRTLAILADGLRQFNTEGRAGTESDAS